MDTMQMGAAGVAIEREINAKLRAEIDRLRAANAELLAACEAVVSRLDYLRGLWGDEAITWRLMDQVKVGIAQARAAGKEE